MQTEAHTQAALQAQLQAQAPAPVPQEHGHGGPSIIKRFKRMAPPSFKGESRPLLEESWIREVEKIFRAIRCAEEDKVSLATYMLQGSVSSVAAPSIRSGIALDFSRVFSEECQPQQQQRKQRQQELDGNLCRHLDPRSTATDGAVNLIGGLRCAAEHGAHAREEEPRREERDERAVCRQESEMEQYLEEKKASHKRPAAPFQRQDRKKAAYQSP
ncbi:hypothetical protein Taro_035203 [Colocasia esculenta]|uniref:Uncharacterized protein n=1 Tax=Colocasia esculenta TaxID=4460 RepID=A0A843W5Z4_COLES|nr:hypothetical protein [Colocasia esculenta]